jgi:ketosteroid isomerase-like protein
MQRVSGRLAVVAAGIIGYVAGTWNVGTASAAKIRRETVQELLDLDRQFDADTTTNGVEGWVTHFAPDGIMLPAASKMVVGQPAIREFISKVFSTPRFAMRWEPVDGGVSGGLGYTYGVSKVTRMGADGKPQVSYGKYVTIWREQRDGAWQIAVDIGNSSPPPAGKAKQ